MACWMTSAVEAHGDILVSDWAQRNLWPISNWQNAASNPSGIPEMDIIGDELVVRRMYLPEGTRDLRIEKRFRLLGDPSAA